MALLSAADQDQLREAFAHLTRSVHLIFFTQTFGCETCGETRRILDELPPLSDKIHIDEVNNVLEPERAKSYGIDRVPAIVVAYEDKAGSLTDTRIRFLGAPSGYEFISLVQALLLAGGRESGLSEASRTRLAAVDQPMTVQVFTTPTCPHCPRAVVLAQEMALANPHITTIAVEATEFPDLSRRYQVSGVPKTVVNETVEILGALPEDAFIEQALGNGTIES